jgi:hypothetical protein
VQQKNLHLLGEESWVQQPLTKNLHLLGEEYWVHQPLTKNLHLLGEEYWVHQQMKNSQTPTNLHWVGYTEQP